LMFPLWFVLLGGSFIFLDMGPSNLYLVLVLASQCTLIIVANMCFAPYD
jgi:hypothetical protein